MGTRDMLTLGCAGEESEEPVMEVLELMGKAKQAVALVEGWKAACQRLMQHWGLKVG